MSSKNVLVTSTEKRVKEGIHYIKITNVMKGAITNTIATNKFDTVNKTEKVQETKVKKISKSEMNQTKLDYWINQGHWINKGLLNPLKQKTQ